MKRNIIFLVVLALIVVVALYVSNSKPEEVPVTTVNTPSIQTNTTADTPTTFDWRFGEAETNNMDGLPQTDMFLAIMHDGKTIDQRVDTVDGSCSELEGEKYDGDVSDTGRVQCYAAGLGQQYRIAKNEHTYSVERKLFEEASPNAAAVPYEWEVIKEFAF